MLHSPIRIFADHAVAIFATVGNTLSVDGVLWHDIGIAIDAPGAHHHAAA